MEVLEAALPLMGRAYRASPSVPDLGMARGPVLFLRNMKCLNSHLSGGHLDEGPIVSKRNPDNSYMITMDRMG